MHCHDELYGKWSCLALVASLRCTLCGRIAGFYIFHVVYLCTDLLKLPSLVLGFEYSHISRNRYYIVARRHSFIRSFVCLLAISVCLFSYSRFLSLHSNLIVFFFSLRYAWSTTLNYRKLHIFSLFPYWMVSVMSLLFPFRSILHSFFFGRSFSYVSFLFLALPLTVLNDLLTEYECMSSVLFFSLSLLPYLF